MISTVYYNNEQVAQVTGTTIDVAYGTKSGFTITDASVQALKTKGKYLSANVTVGDKTLKTKNKYLAKNIVIDTVKQTYTISTNLTGCTAVSTNPTTIQEGGTATLYFTAQSGYSLSSATVTVTGASYTGDENGQIILSNPTGNVSITIVAKVSKSYSIATVGSYGFTKGSVTNPDSTLYDGVYQSTNQGQGSTYSVAKITFTGYSSFTVYIRSSAESSYDYTIASTIDASAYPTSSSSNAQASTSGNQQSGTTIGSYTAVTYSNDGGTHFIYVVFRKDGSVDTSPDTGYFLIKK